MKDQQRCGFANFIRSDLRFIDIPLTHNRALTRPRARKGRGEGIMPVFIDRGGHRAAFSFRE